MSVRATVPLQASYIKWVINSIVRNRWGKTNTLLMSEWTVRPVGGDRHTGAARRAHVVPGCKTVLLGNGNAPTGNNRKSRRTSGVITVAERSRVALTHTPTVFILLATERSPLPLYRLRTPDLLPLNLPRERLMFHWTLYTSVQLLNDFQITKTLLLYFKCSIAKKTIRLLKMLTYLLSFVSFQGPLIPAAFTNGYHWKCYSTNILREYYILISF